MAETNQTTQNTAERPCAGCGNHTPETKLDSRPADVPGTEEALSAAADAGRDFDSEFCRPCYGPAFLASLEA